MSPLPVDDTPRVIRPPRPLDIRPVCTACGCKIDPQTAECRGCSGT